MWKFLLRSFLLTSVFSSGFSRAFSKQKRKYNQAVSEHYKSLDKQVKYLQNAFRAYPNDEELVCNCIANFLDDNLYCYKFSLDDINYMLNLLYHQGFPNEALKIQELINEMPETELI